MKHPQITRQGIRRSQLALHGGLQLFDVPNLTSHQRVMVIGLTDVVLATSFSTEAL